MKDAKSFLLANFDKLLLVALIFRFSHIALGEHDLHGFAVRTIDTLVGALIGIITGKYMALSLQGEHNQSTTNSNPQPPSDEDK